MIFTADLVLGVAAGLLLAALVAQALAHRRARRILDALQSPALLLRGEAISAVNEPLRALLAPTPPPRELPSLFAPADWETLRRLLAQPEGAGQDSRPALLLTLPGGRLPVIALARRLPGGLRLVRFTDQRPALRLRELETLAAWYQERLSLAARPAEFHALLAGLLDNFSVAAARLVHRPLAAAGLRRSVPLATRAQDAAQLAALDAGLEALPGAAATSDAAAPHAFRAIGLDLTFIGAGAWPPPAALLLPAGSLSDRPELRQTLERLGPALAARIGAFEQSARAESAEHALTGLVEIAPLAVAVIAGPPGRRRLRQQNPPLARLFATPGEPLTFARFAAAHDRMLPGPALDALLALLEGGAPGASPLTLEFAGGEGKLLVHHRRSGGPEAEPADLLVYEDRRAATEYERILAEKYRQLELLHDSRESAHQELARQAADLKAAHQQLAAKHQELQSLYRDLKGTAEFKSALLGNMTHELKSPLVSISGYLELLRRGQGGALAEPQLKLLDVALRNLQNLHSVISRLIEYSQLERDGILLNPARIPLGSWAAGVVARHAPRAAAADIRIEFHPPLAEIELTADAHLLETLLANLLDNAVKFSAAGSRVEVTALAQGAERAALIVSDSGCGIPRELQQRVFDGFFQVDRSLARTAAGLGIGLAMVRRIASLHGGTVALQSAPGQGSSFTVSLPLRPPAENEARGHEGSDHE
jgi:signal transduction histidine kinase